MLRVIAIDGVKVFQQTESRLTSFSNKKTLKQNKPIKIDSLKVYPIPDPTDNLCCMYTI